MTPAQAKAFAWPRLLVDFLLLAGMILVSSKLLTP
jgi:hypothetical protein